MIQSWTLAILLLAIFSTNAQSQERINLWEGDVPLAIEEKHEARQTPDTSGQVMRLIDVSNPNVLVFEPDVAMSNGAGIIVCPGGGYRILAYDKEGIEIAEWLNSLGYTAFVLQYRVPDQREAALCDVQRAIRWVRSQQTKYGIETGKLGVLGFSAGGSLSARASTQFLSDNFTKQDAIDELSARPDFALLIYPAYLDLGENRTLTPELTITEQTPPMFIFATADDYYGNSALVMATALRDHKISVELHLLATGGHGYGLRKGNSAAETWPFLAEEWLNGLWIEE